MGQVWLGHGEEEFWKIKKIFTDLGLFLNKKEAATWLKINLF